MEVAETGEEAPEKGDSPNIKKDNKEKKRNKIRFDKETEYLENGKKEIDILRKNTVFAQEGAQNAKDVQVQRQNFGQITNSPGNFRRPTPEEADRLLHSSQQFSQRVQDCAIGIFERTPYPYKREGEHRSSGRPRGKYHDPEEERKKELQRLHRAKSTSLRIERVHKVRDQFKPLDDSFQEFTRKTSESISRAKAVADRMNQKYRDLDEMERHMLNCAFDAIVELETALKKLKNWYGSPPVYSQTASPYSSVSIRKKKNTSIKTADLDNANSGAAGNSTIENKDEQNLIQFGNYGYPGNNVESGFGNSASNIYPPQGDIHKTPEWTSQAGYPGNNVESGFGNSASNIYPPQGDIHKTPEWTSQAGYPGNNVESGFGNSASNIYPPQGDIHKTPEWTSQAGYPGNNVESGFGNSASNIYPPQGDIHKTPEWTSQAGHEYLTTQRRFFHNPIASSQSLRLPLTMGRTEPVRPHWCLDNESDNAPFHYANRVTQNFAPQYYGDQQLAPCWINAGDEISGGNKPAIVSNPYDELSE